MPEGESGGTFVARLGGPAADDARVQGAESWAACT